MKHLTVDGLVREHNRYVPLRASALVGRCDGTGKMPAAQPTGRVS